nr:MAG TPA: hypothetical protein [Caudoviricetes sp.]
MLSQEGRWLRTSGMCGPQTAICWRISMMSLLVLTGSVLASLVSLHLNPLDGQMKLGMTNVRLGMIRSL